MKKFLLVSGIILVAAGIVCLLLSGFFYYSHHHIMDGSSELYKRLHGRATACLIAGTVTEVCGIAALAVRYFVY